MGYGQKNKLESSVMSDNMLAKIKEQELVEISAECQKPNGDFQIWWIQKDQLAVLLLGLQCTQKKKEQAIRTNVWTRGDDKVTKWVKCNMAAKNATRSLEQWGSSAAILARSAISKQAPTQILASKINNKLHTRAFKLLELSYSTRATQDKQPHEQGIVQSK